MTTTPIPANPAAPIEPTSDFFVDISEQSGMTEDNYYDPEPEGLPSNDHGRVQCADLNGDGYDDLVMHSFGSNPNAGFPYDNLVFINNQDGTFTNFSDDSGLREVQAEFFAFGDVDNDGDQDIFSGLPIYMYYDYRNEIYLNDGDGHFTKVENSGVNDTDMTRAGNALFADFNGDAKLDLYVGNGGTAASAYDFLYLGNGDGTFEDVSDRLKQNVNIQPSNGSVVCDYDNDGDMDIFVSTYGVSRYLGMNQLWKNDGDGPFSRKSLWSRDLQVSLPAIPTSVPPETEPGTNRMSARENMSGPTVSESIAVMWTMTATSTSGWYASPTRTAPIILANGPIPLNC